MITRVFSITRRLTCTAPFAAILAATLFASIASAQVSSNASLKGAYYFRQILLITDGTANVTTTTSGSGTLTFDGTTGASGAGTFTISGQQLTGTTAATALTGSGTYTVQPGGFVTFTNPLHAGAVVNARLGTGALVGSSTEAGMTVFDLFIAIPAASGTSSATLSGEYWISSLEFPNGGTANIRDTNFVLTANGSGSFAESAITGQAANLGNTLQTQTIGPNTYAISPDGTGTLTFATVSGLTSATQLIGGMKSIFVAQDGSYFIGGSTQAGGQGLVLGVKAIPNAAATNASWNGFYFAAGMRYDVANTAFGLPARLAGVSGAVHANGDGNSIWERRTRQSDGLFDAAPLIIYNLGTDGSGPITSATGHVDVAAGAKVFSTTGVDVASSTSYEIYFGALMPPQSGSGVFINPQYVLNAASFAPAGYPLSPGGFITIAGTGLATQSATAKVPFPPTLGGVSMTVNGIAAPMYSVVGGTSPVINAVVPFAVTGSTATIVVTVGTTKSNTVVVPLAATAPGIFSVPPNGISGGAMRHLDGTLVSATSPAARDEYISVYLTGLGTTSPAVLDGAAAPGSPPLANITGPVNVYVGGIQTATPQYAGLAPGFAGLYQLNIQIPAASGSGAQSLAVQTEAGFTDMVTIWVQ
jgi:uncharacterized protein (TIGR03437 family)